MLLRFHRGDPSLNNIYAEADHIQPIEYVPTPVTELLRDMKDLSSLILDLAYSAVLFNDEDLYGEVQRIERLVDHKNHMLEFNIMLAVRNVSQAEDAHSLLHVAAAANRISDAAADIGSVVRRNLGFPRLISEIMQRTAERVARVRVKSDSPLLRLTIFEIMYKLGTDIIAIERQNTWLFGFLTSLNCRVTMFYLFGPVMRLWIFSVKRQQAQLRRCLVSNQNPLDVVV